MLSLIFEKRLITWIEIVYGFNLLKSGIRGNMYDIIKHMYEETTASVKHQGILGDIFECNLGVRQGESISPFLFNLFLNYLN